MDDHEERHDALDEEVEKLEHEAARVERDIDEARSDWESKQDSSAVPGAVAESEESDQLPEEGPPEQVPTTPAAMPARTPRTTRASPARRSAAPDTSPTSRPATPSA